MKDPAILRFRSSMKTRLQPALTMYVWTASVHVIFTPDERWGYQDDKASKIQTISSRAKPLVRKIFML